MSSVFTLIFSDHLPHRASDINSLLVRTIFMIQMYCTSPKRKKYVLWYYLHVASFFSIALLCLSLASWYFIPSCLITALPYTKTESFSVTPSSLHAVQNMSPSVYFSHGRPCIQLNCNDLSRVSSCFFLQSTVFVSSFIFHFLPDMASL